MMLLAALKTLLYHYTSQEQICVGSPIANRNRGEIEGLIGLFVNTVVLATNLSGNPSFQELLRRVRDGAVGAYANQDLPFEKLVEELQPERNMSQTLLFQVMFVLQNTPMPALELAGLALSPLEIDSKTVKFDLMLSLWETTEGLNGCFEYNTALFEAATIARMAGHFETILGKIVAQPDVKLNALAESLTEADKEQQSIKAKEFEASNLQMLKNIKRKPLSSSKS
jgi:non-ribosomal peptide synthetase component F